jgi:hypothetical protein
MSYVLHVLCDRCNLWLRIDVRVGIIAYRIFGPLALHLRCRGSISRRACWCSCNGVDVCLVFLVENLVDFYFFVYVAVDVTVRREEGVFRGDLALRCPNSLGDLP